MIPLQSRPKVPSLSSNVNGKRRKTFSGGMLIGVGVTLLVALLAVGAFAAQKLAPSHAASNDYNGGSTTINGLHTIKQVGSTANILDANGNPITADPNPYKIAIAPADLSPKLKAGDVLVSNIGNEDHGVTIVKFKQQPGTGHVFNATGAGVLGPSGLVFDNGKLLVANAAGNNVLALNPDGTLFKTITSPLFNGPWGITLGNPKSDGSDGKDGRNRLTSFFTANKFDGKILRVDVTSSRDGKAMQFNVVQIGKYDLVGTVSKIDLHWLPKFKVGDKDLKDVLLTIDPAGNRVAAFAKSSTLQGVTMPVTVFKGKPLNNPGGLAINPLNNDILVVNLGDNNLVELNAQKGTVVGVKAIDPLIVDAQGNNSALFGVIAIKDDQGNLKVFYTDDNTNTLNVLSK